MSDRLADRSAGSQSAVRRLVNGVAVAPRGGRARGLLSVALVVLATLSALAGGLALYARDEIVDSSAFADRAVDALRQPELQRVVAREIAVQLLEPALPDLIAGRPVLESAVSLAVGSKPFRPVIRLAAVHGHRLLFERHGGNAVFQVADAGTVVYSALRSLAPRLAREIPSRAEAVLATLRRRGFAAATLRFAETVRLLGVVLPVVALVLFAGAIGTAPDRRRVITRSGIAVGVTGVAFAIALELFRRYVISHTYGTKELSNADVRGAVGDLWGAYLGDLMTWTLGFTAAAWLVAAASAPVLPPYSPATGLRRLRELARLPVSQRVRAVRGAVGLALGIVTAVAPGFALRVLAVLGGCLLIYVGAGEVLSATAPAQPRLRRLRPRPPRRPVAIAALCAVAAAGIILAFALTGGASRVSARSPLTCNGYASLCGRRLDEVAFAGTHNSMSAADTRGWLIANQDHAIDQQLQDGIRLFKISTHYGVKSPAGGVHTDIAASGASLNRVAAKLAPAARQALQRLSFSLAPGSLANSKRDIWLCHTLCELGATRMVDFLAVIRRFLELNPNQVIILFDEDYVAERDLQGAFKRAGLFRRLATLQPGQPLPTLADLIGSRRNLVVFAQEPTSGRYPWDQYAFNWIKDTPLGATKPSQFTCNLYRGRPSNPLLMMNNWADIFPPRPTPNLPLVKKAFILARARRCSQRLGRIPNLILTDYYNRGDVVGAVNTLNVVDNQRAAETIAPPPIR
jgi:hypothetical protein